MTISPDDSKNAADRAILFARQYIEDDKKLAQSRLTCAPDEELLVEGFHVQLGIRKMHTITESIIRDTVGSAKEAAPGEKRNVTILAGPLGAKHLLLDAAKKENATGTGAEIKEALGNSVLLDFAEYKTKFVKCADESCEPYAKVRPLMSGIDVALQELAKKKGLNIVLDNTLVPVDDKEKPLILDFLKAYRENDNLRMYAVALTPDEAREEAEKHGMSGDEAAKTASLFAQFFDELKAVVPDITLVNKEGKLLYAQRPSPFANKPPVLLSNDVVALMEWKTACKKQHPLPGNFPPRAGGMGKSPGK